MAQILLFSLQFFFAICGCGCGANEKIKCGCGCGCGANEKIKCGCGCGCSANQKTRCGCGCGCGPNDEIPKPQITPQPRQKRNSKNRKAIFAVYFAVFLRFAVAVAVAVQGMHRKSVYAIYRQKSCRKFLIPF